MPLFFALHFYSKKRVLYLAMPLFALLFPLKLNEICLNLGVGIVKDNPIII